MRFDLQINPGLGSWSEICAVACVAQDVGFKTLWTVDHLSGEIMQTQQMPECFTLLGALASATTTIELGPLVVNVGNRHPGLLANSAATVQQISGGRLVLGLGAGSSPTSRFANERIALDWPPAQTMVERHQSVNTTLDVFDQLWGLDRAAQFDTFSRPNPRPPIVLGVNSVALAKIAGSRTNGVNVGATHDNAESILVAASAAHRDSGIDKPFTVSVWEHFDEALLRGDDPRLETWKSWGVDRVVLLMFRSIDIAQLRNVEKYLR